MRLSPAGVQHAADGRQRGRPGGGRHPGRVRSRGRADGAGGRCDVQQGHRADPATRLRAVPPARRRRADVADRLRGGPPLGARHPGAHPGPRDAAVVRRQEHRHPALHRRSVVDGRGDPADRRVGGRRRPARQSGRHAAAARMASRRAVEHRHAGPGRVVAGHDGRGAGSRLVRHRQPALADRPRRGPLDQGSRDQGSDSRRRRPRRRAAGSGRRRAGRRPRPGRPGSVRRPPLGHHRRGHRRRGGGGPGRRLRRWRPGRPRQPGAVRHRPRAGPERHRLPGPRGREAARELGPDVQEHAPALDRQAGAGAPRHRLHVPPAGARAEVPADDRRAGRRVRAGAGHPGRREQRAARRVLPRHSARRC